MKYSEVEKSEKINDKIIQVLKILYSGEELKMGINTIFFAPTENGSVQPCLKYSDDNFIGADMSVSTFFKLCESVTEEDITFAIANIALSDSLFNK